MVLVKTTHEFNLKELNSMKQELRIRAHIDKSGRSVTWADHIWRRETCTGKRVGCGDGSIGPSSWLALVWSMIPTVSHCDWLRPRCCVWMWTSCIPQKYVEDTFLENLVLNVDAVHSVEAQGQTKRMGGAHRRASALAMLKALGRKERKRGKEERKDLYLAL